MLNYQLFEILLDIDGVLGANWQLLSAVPSKYIKPTSASTANHPKNHGTANEMKANLHSKDFQLCTKTWNRPPHLAIRIRHIRTIPESTAPFQYCVCLLRRKLVRKALFPRLDHSQFRSTLKKAPCLRWRRDQLFRSKQINHKDALLDDRKNGAWNVIWHRIYRQ